MTPEEALHRLIENAHVVARFDGSKQIHPREYLLCETDEALMDYLASFRSETEDMEPEPDDEDNGDDEENGDLEADYADWEPEHDNEPDYVNMLPPDYGEGSQAVTSAQEYRKLFMRS